MLYKMVSVNVIMWGCYYCYLLLRVLYILGAFFNEAIIPLVLAGYEMITANSTLPASLAIYCIIIQACGIIVKYHSNITTIHLYNIVTHKVE